jgi:hypothetical protein
METDLSIRLHAYAATAEAQIPDSTLLYADAVASSRAASTAASASIICSHTRELRGDSEPAYLLPGQDELDVLVADKPKDDDAPHRIRLPFRPGNGTIASLALGAAAIAAIKSPHE